jgi:hypothetical protein
VNTPNEDIDDNDVLVGVRPLTANNMSGKHANSKYLFIYIKIND